MKDLPRDGKTSVIASETYSQTLAKYHAWLIKQAGYLAIKTLPTKEVFVQRYCKQELSRVEELADSTVASMQDIFDIAQGFYIQHDLLELP